MRRVAVGGIAGVVGALAIGWYFVGGLDTGGEIGAFEPPPAPAPPAEPVTEAPAPAAPLVPPPAGWTAPETPSTRAAEVGFEPPEPAASGGPALAASQLPRGRRRMEVQEGKMEQVREAVVSVGDEFGWSDQQVADLTEVLDANIEDMRELEKAVRTGDVSREEAIARAIGARDSVKDALFNLVGPDGAAALEQAMVGAVDGNLSRE